MQARMDQMDQMELKLMALRVAKGLVRQGAGETLMPEGSWGITQPLTANNVIVLAEQEAGVEQPGAAASESGGETPWQFDEAKMAAAQAEALAEISEEMNKFMEDLRTTDPEGFAEANLGYSGRWEPPSLSREPPTLDSDEETTAAAAKGGAAPPFPCNMLLSTPGNMGYGCWALSRDDEHMTRPDEASSIALIHRALDLGVRGCSSRTALWHCLSARPVHLPQPLLLLLPPPLLSTLRWAR